MQFDHSETDGDLFDEMDMKLEAIASMTGMSGIFKLMGADVYKVISLNQLAPDFKIFKRIIFKMFSSHFFLFNLIFLFKFRYKISYLNKLFLNLWTKKS